MARNITRPGGYTPGQRHTDLQAVVSLLTGAAALLRGRADLPELAEQVMVVCEDAVAERDEAWRLVCERAAAESDQAVQE